MIWHEKKYKTIVADPPWQYRNKKMIGTWKDNGGAESHYQTMSLSEICNLSLIKKILDKNCICFLWATVPMLPEAFQVLKAWGFKYKTMLIWVKIKTLPMGFWFRVNLELCLLGIKGNIKAFRQLNPNLFFAPITEHSKKPEKFFQLIDPIIPRPAIELFARQKREGWDAWGDKIEMNNILGNHEI
jgi:site-specific DNA-methyltransferase (adenine-specific)